MKLSRVKIKNYRNFFDEDISLNNETIIIGPNDVGKTNLLMAIRILLDKSLSYLDLEPEERDFNIFSDEEEITIILEFSEISENSESFIYASLGQDIEDSKMYLMYKGYKNSEEKFKFFMSAKEDEESFHEIPGRNKYINLINCVYLDSTRQLKSFLKKSKANIINSYKQKRDSKEIDDDNNLILEIDKQVNYLNQKVENVSYISKSTEFIKSELSEMSSHNDNLDIKFSSYNDTNEIMDNVELITQVDGKNVNIGGDGRSNQIYMSMWIKEKNEKYDDSKQFVIFILEEPESHLHFPLQSMTIRQLLKKINSQLIVTSHSPQVVLEFNPFSIVKLSYNKDKKTIVSNNGCSKELEDDVIKFGYRYNLITGSMFFSSGVFLVEGVSELLIYKYISSKLDINLEKYNIMIVPVDGIGFKPYAKLLDRLSIPYAVRTDNDIVINSKNKKIYYSGINRLIDLHNEKIMKNDWISKEEFSNLNSEKLSSESLKLYQKYKKDFMDEGLFISEKDLENDLSNIDFLSDYIKQNYNGKDEFVKYLQNSKAKNMYDFIDEIKNINITRDNIGDFYKPIEWLIGKVNE
jgi:putative ATP-dependent endonuclease of OLD family